MKSVKLNAKYINSLSFTRAIQKYKGLSLSYKLIKYRIK